MRRLYNDSVRARSLGARRSIEYAAVMTYIASGQFLTDLEEVTGQSFIRNAGADVEDDENEDEDEDEEFTLDDFDPKVRAELEALRALTESGPLPTLCELSWGGFYPVPYEEGAERDEVLEDWFDGDEAATDFAMGAVTVVDGNGGFYIQVNKEGRMGLLCEDPYSFDALECTLQQFLQALIAAHRAVCTDGVAAGKAELSKTVGSKAKLLLSFAQRLAPEKKAKKKK